MAVGMCAACRLNGQAGFGVRVRISAYFTGMLVAGKEAAKNVLR